MVWMISTMDQKNSITTNISNLLGRLGIEEYPPVATVIVLSKGCYERLQVCPETLEMLERRGIPVQI